jgi:hypothetical protein
MSLVLAVIRRGFESDAPILRVRCASCGRVYQTKSWPTNVRSQKRCVACRPGPLKRTCVAGGKSRKGIRRVDGIWVMPGTYCKAR